VTSCLLFEGWFAHLLPTRAAVQAVENCSLWLLAENGFWAADQICIVASRWSRWLLAFASYLYMLYSNYIYLCDMDMGMNLYEFDIYIYICVCVYRSIYRIYIYYIYVHVSCICSYLLCSAGIDRSPQAQFWGHQLLRCPLSPLGLAAEMMELKGGPWRAVQIQSHQAEQQRECDGIGMDAEGSNETTCSKMFKH
jgi:hypothetical protein